MLEISSKLLKTSLSVEQAYFFTDFPAPTETGISETLSLGKKFLSLAKKSLSLAKKSSSLAKNPRVLYIFPENSTSPLNRAKFDLIKILKLQLKNFRNHEFTKKMLEFREKLEFKFA